MPFMNGRVEKSRRSSRTRLKASREILLGAALSQGAGHTQDCREEFAKGFARIATPEPSRKRRIDTTFDIDLLPVKRARASGTDAQRPGVEVEKAEQTAEFEQTTLQQPKPKPPKRPYASFFEKFVDSGPRPESVDTFISEWLESVGSDREKRCRSDSHLHRSDNDSLSRQLLKSAPPEMGRMRNTDGFVVPPTPASTGSRSYRATAEDSASSTASVRHPSYRQDNLWSNNVEVRDSRSQLPDLVFSHVREIRAERDSPDLPSDQLNAHLDKLDALARGCIEADVEAFLKDAVFPKDSDPVYGRTTGLETATSTLMSPHLVPSNPESPFRISQPKPDMLYGYSAQSAFTRSQLLAQTYLHPRNRRFAQATSQGLRLPFFAIEFKAAGGIRGDLWVATNQCAGASAACLNTVERLNSLLHEHKSVSLQEHKSVQLIDNLSYSVAVDNNIAQLYISWKEDELNYYVQRVGTFLLSSPEHFKDFRRQVRNILNWGKDRRLKQIRDALDIVLEENRNQAAEHAKSRPPPSNSTTTTSSKKHKSSLSSRSSMKGQINGAAEPYWQWDGTYKRYFHLGADGSITWAEEKGQSSSVL